MQNCSDLNNEWSWTHQNFYSNHKTYNSNSLPNTLSLSLNLTKHYAVCFTYISRPWQTSQQGWCPYCISILGTYKITILLSSLLRFSQSICTLHLEETLFFELHSDFISYFCLSWNFIEFKVSLVVSMDWFLENNNKLLSFNHKILRYMNIWIIFPLWEVSWRKLRCQIPVYVVCIFRENLISFSP